MAEYQAYVKTGVKWIPELPKQWRLRKIDSLFTERKTKVSDKDFAPLSVTKKGILPQLEHAAKSNDGDNRKLVKVDDFVINSRSDRKGSCGVSSLNGSVSLINIVLTPREELNPDYIHYLLRNYRFSEEYYRNGRGIVADLWTTRYSEMRTIQIPVPSRAEQDQIVRFLDWKISEINRLIGIRKKEIQILEELKKKLTFQILTKGLNKNSVLKYSDNYWIGKIPKHWKVLQIRRLYNVILGKMLSSNKSDSDESLEEYVCAKDVHFGHVNLLNLKKMWFSQNEKKQYQIHSGDLLIVEGGAGAGNAAIVNKMLDKKIYIQNSIHVVRAKDNTASVKFLAYWIESLVARDYMKYICSVATIPHFTKDKVLSTPMPFPPIEEQYQIVNYLDNAYTKIDGDVSSKKTQIETLQELKSSIISDVVTGKIDVRNIPIPEYEHVDDADVDTADDTESEAEERGE